MRSVPTARALRTENAIDLLQREARKRVALVHDEYQTGCGPLRIVVRATGEFDLERGISEGLLEGLERCVPNAVSHEADIRLPRHETCERLRSVDQVRVQAHKIGRASCRERV